MTLNKLPDGSDAPKYEITAISHSGEEMTRVFTEWWYEGDLVEPINNTAADFFYTAFDKEGFDIVNIRRI